MREDIKPMTHYRALLFPPYPKRLMLPIPVAVLILLLALVPASLLAVDRISVVALFRDKAMVEIDGKQRLLKKDVPSPEGVVLISATAKAAVLEIDGTQAEYLLGRRISTQYNAPPQGASIRIWPTANGMYLSSGLINGFPVRFLVDTGATLVAMNRNQAKRLGLDFRIIGTESRSSTASGIVRTYVLTLDRVRLGDIELRNVEAAVMDGDFPTDILLGNSFLNRLTMSRSGKALDLTERGY